MPFQQVSGDQGERAVWILRVDKAVAADINKALTNELLVGDVRIDSRAVILSHAPAGLIFQISPEEGPGPADIRLVFVYRASAIRLKKYAGSICLAGEDRFALLIHCMGGQHFVSGNVQARGETMDIFGRENDPSLSLTTLTAHAADKGVRHVT